MIGIVYRFSGCISSTTLPLQLLWALYSAVTFLVYLVCLMLKVVIGKPSTARTHIFACTHMHKHKDFLRTSTCTLSPPHKEKLLCLPVCQTFLFNTYKDVPASFCQLYCVKWDLQKNFDYNKTLFPFFSSPTNPFSFSR